MILQCDSPETEEIISYLNILDNYYFQNNKLFILNDDIFSFIEPYTLKFLDDFSKLVVKKHELNNLKEILLENDNYDYLSTLGNYNLSQDDYLIYRDFI